VLPSRARQRKIQVGPPSGCTSRYGLSCYISACSSSVQISVPLDSPHVSPGATIPLFPGGSVFISSRLSAGLTNAFLEENVKVLSSQVHPLDQNGAPYSFAASSSPLLYSAARALNMPARSQETFESAFRLPKTNSHSSVLHTSKPETLDGTPPVDMQYTGQILVSGYSVAFVLPKVFLPSRRHKEGSHSDIEDDPPPLQTPPSRRRPSIGERNQAQFMAAIDMWIPFVTKPTRSPYLVCPSAIVGGMTLADSSRSSSLYLPLDACITKSSFGFFLLPTRPRQWLHYPPLRTMATRGI